jgi:hypothetical protein
MKPKRRAFIQAVAGGAAASSLFAARSLEGAGIVRKVEAIPARVPYRDTFVIGRGLVAAGGQAVSTSIYE